MPLTVFLAFCIHGFDFLLYVLFQWIYGEKYREHACRVAARDKRRALSANQPDPPRVLPFPKNALRFRSGSF